MALIEISKEHNVWGRCFSLKKKKQIKIIHCEFLGRTP